MKAKAKAEPKDQQIRIRLTLWQKKTLAAAARRAGMSLSSWLLALGLRGANQ